MEDKHSHFHIQHNDCIWCVDYKGIVRPLIWHRHTHARMHVHTRARFRYKELIIENACKTKTISDLLYNK